MEHCEIFVHWYVCFLLCKMVWQLLVIAKDIIIYYKRKTTVIKIICFYFPTIMHNPTYAKLQICNLNI